MKLASLHIYPIKGARPVNPQRALVGPLGLALDRQWMLIDAKGTFCSQRTLPELGNLQVEIEAQGLRLDQDLLVPFEAPLHETMWAQVWRDRLEVQVFAPEIQSWIQKRFGQDLRLVRYFEQSRRRTPQADPVAFADGFPLLICNQASLADLNQRLHPPAIEMRAFRPNLVIDSQRPWAEDEWSYLQVGEARFELISACRRCKVTTLCPDNPHKFHPHKEPLSTLANFRRSAKGVTFGWNAVLRSPEATLQVGDLVST